MLDKLKEIAPNHDVNLLILLVGGILVLLIIIVPFLFKLFKNSDKNKLKKQLTIAGVVFVLGIGGYFVYNKFFKTYTLNTDSVACKSIDGKHAYHDYCLVYPLQCVSESTNYITMKKFDCTRLPKGRKVKLLDKVKVYEKTFHDYVYYAKIKTEDGQIYYVSIGAILDKDDINKDDFKEY